MAYDIIIVGGGPAGLACARTAADRGMRTLVIERKRNIGKKVCAGGITWNGLIQKLPGFSAEKTFPSQHLFSKFQRAKITAKTPIIATVNRQKLGQYMAGIVENSGAEIRTSCLLKTVDTDRSEITLSYRDTGSVEKIKYNYLVGADGASSLVRRHLGIPVDLTGVGINYQIPGEFSKMQWHFDGNLFANGYAWVFPHADTASIGAYANTKVIQPALLKQNLLQWAKKAGFGIDKGTPTAEIINFDYRGWRFKGNVFLAGEAAGLVSGLTGEGIYPAIISGSAIAQYISTPDSPRAEFSRLLAIHKKHLTMALMTGRNRFAGTVMAELIIFCLRTGLIPFNRIEMAN
ncbi:MAG: NAD(P)/FAD-dependent oxidoreductase [Desulfobulbaceae bacterium]|nr:NAD(P)/FAD-dependent oxidoreductase [Desulfobulbaceae bacterium]